MSSYQQVRVPARASNKESPARKKLNINVQGVEEGDSGTTNSTLFSAASEIIVNCFNLVHCRTREI